MKINIESNPITYVFNIDISVYSKEQDGEKYLSELMNHYNNFNFKIINGKYKREKMTHDRLGHRHPDGLYCDIIYASISMELKVKNIHNPKDYIDNILEKRIYGIFDLFNKNDDKLDYIWWINIYYTEEYNKS